jgi:hypothetical protein
VQDCGDIGVVDPRLDEHGAHDVLHDDGVVAYSGSSSDECFTAIPTVRLVRSPALLSTVM